MSLAPQEAVHVSKSPLLEKARRYGLELPLDLERLALRRGCDYYDREIVPRVTPLEEVPLSNVELAVALVAPSLNPSAREIRLSAALLGASDVRADEVAALAIEESCAETIRYIAEAGHKFESENLLWSELLELLPQGHAKESSLPHPTRFVEMTGIDRGMVGTSVRWIRPRHRLAA